MVAKLTLSDLASLENQSSAIATINANNTLIENAMEVTLSRYGGTSNSMSDSLDMNNQPIINLPAPVSGLSPLRLSDYDTLISGGTIYVNNNIGVEYIIDGGGSQIATGLHGYIQVPFGGVITGVYLLSDQSGSAAVDIWKCTYSDFNPPTHPAVGDTIVAAAIPTITGSTKYSDTTLTGWTTSFSANDVFAFYVNSATSIERLTVVLSVTKTS